MAASKDPPKLFGEFAIQCTSEPITCHTCWHQYNKNKKKAVVHYVEWDEDEKICECCFPKLECMVIVHSAAIFSWIATSAKRAEATSRQETQTVRTNSSYAYPRRVSLYNENSRSPVAPSTIVTIARM